MVEKIHFNSFLCPSPHTSSNHLVILNSDSFCVKLTKNMWGKCEIKVCADGGANRLYDSLSDGDRGDYIPQYIVGDLDSLRSEVRHFYEANGTTIKRVASQEENDLDKAILLIRAVIETGSTSYIDGLGLSCTSGKINQISGSRHNSIDVIGDDDEGTGRTIGEAATTTAIGERSILLSSSASDSFSPGVGLDIRTSVNSTLDSTIVLMGAYGGRFDQELAAVSSMFRWLDIYSRIVMVGSNACTFLLQPGYLHRIRCVDSTHLRHQPGQAFAKEGPTCGLIPVGGVVNSITTTGFEWDLHGERLQLGVRISSSNCILPGSAEVTVETSDTVLWTVQMHVL